MRIAVLSGKGGTGKTFVSVNLAAVSKSATYLDCDVEEPNGALFLQPQGLQTKTVDTMVPVVDASACNGCRTCVEYCKFNALAYIKENLRVFPELCHGCEGCVVLCPEKALSVGARRIGVIEEGVGNGVAVKTGRLDIGQATGVPIIRQLVSEACSSEHLIIDCPPGSSCVVMESIREADYCILVAEPTAFGIHDLDMVYRLVRLFDIPFGLVINKQMDNAHMLDAYCRERSIPVIGRIPYDAEAGNVIAEGLIAAHRYTPFRETFINILNEAEGRAAHGTTGGSER